MGNFNYLDVIIFILLFIASFRGVSAGFLYTLFSVLGVLAGMAAAAKYYAYAGSLIHRIIDIPTVAADVISFTVIFLTVISLVSIINILVKKINRFGPFVVADKVLGALAGLGMGMAITAALVIILLAFPLLPNFQEHTEESLLALPIADAVQEFYHKAYSVIPFDLPSLAFYPEQLAGYLNPLQSHFHHGEDYINFRELDGSLCIVCYEPVEFLGFLTNDSGTISPKFHCTGCGRTSDGCQTFLGHHLMYGECPIVLGRKGNRFDCGIWSNGIYHRPTGTCPVCGESN